MVLLEDSGGSSSSEDEGTVHHHHTAIFCTNSREKHHEHHVPVTIVKREREACHGCGHLICDRYLLKVSDTSWHAPCLRCSDCDSPLDHHASCFVRDGSVFCRTDYIRRYGAKCAKCFRAIQASDWVRRARERVYHLACFACDQCKRQLSTGEEFALHNGQVLCKTHYHELVDGGTGSNDENADSEPSTKTKTKRVRTTFTEEQLQVLQANFNLDSNPDGQDLERIAQITGLSKRVTQVWFQNSRARQKKYFNNQVKKGPPSSQTSDAACSNCGLLYCMCSNGSSSAASTPGITILPPLN